MNIDFSIIADKLTLRAKRARRSAWLSTLLIIFTVFAIIILFYGNELLSQRLITIGHNYSGIKTINESWGEVLAREKQVGDTNEIKKMRIELELKQVEVDLKKAELAKSSEESSRLTRAISNSVAKIAAVFIAIYLIQILISLMRYYFKLADHFETVSEAMRAADNDINTLQEIIAVIGVGHIGFGQFPEAPIKSILEVTKELVQKLKSLQLEPNKNIKSDVEKTSTPSPKD